MVRALPTAPAKGKAVGSPASTRELACGCLQKLLQKYSNAHTLGRLPLLPEDWCRQISSNQTQDKAPQIHHGLIQVVVLALQSIVRLAP